MAAPDIAEHKSERNTITAAAGGTRLHLPTAPAAPTRYSHWVGGVPVYVEDLCGGGAAAEQRHDTQRQQPLGEAGSGTTGHLWPGRIESSRSPLPDPTRHCHWRCAAGPPSTPLPIPARTPLQRIGPAPRTPQQTQIGPRETDVHPPRSSDTDCGPAAGARRGRAELRRAGRQRATRRRRRRPARRRAAGGGRRREG